MDQTWCTLYIIICPPRVELRVEIYRTGGSTGWKVLCAEI